MKKRRLDWLFWVGVGFLLALVAFAVVGPSRFEVNETAKRNYYEVGIRFDTELDNTRVSEVLSDSPAHAAGVLPGDVVTRIGGQNVLGARAAEAERLFIGPEGSEVEVVLLKGGTDTAAVSLKRLFRPGAQPFMAPSREFWLGTDDLGRDVFSRLGYGARMSLLIGFLVEAIALAVGIVMGTLGVFAPKWVSIPILRLTDAMFAFPDILLAILIIGIWSRPEARFVALIVALSITAWPGVARLVRTQIASLKDRDYVVASKALGGGTTYLVVKHILPHLWGILLAVAMIDVAGVILAESSLSFLGIGIQRPTPSWGSMIDMSRINMNSEPMMLFWPCLVLSLTIFALNFVGDGLRSLADPKSS